VFGVIDFFFQTSIEINKNLMRSIKYPRASHASYKIKTFHYNKTQVPFTSQLAFFWFFSKLKIQPIKVRGFCNTINYEYRLKNQLNMLKTSKTKL
jgi:hypothetical protein